MQTAIITKVFVADKSKDGKPFISKNGKPFWKVGIKTDRTGEQWYTTVVFREDSPEKLLKEGDEKLLSLEHKGEFFNFRLPTKIDILDAKIDELNQRMRNLEQRAEVAGWGAHHQEKDNPKVADGIDADDIPWN